MERDKIMDTENKGIFRPIYRLYKKLYTFIYRKDQTFKNKGKTAFLLGKASKVRIKMDRKLNI